MSLITVHLGMVKPHGTNDVPAVASGRVEFTPTTHGKYAGAFRTIETVNSSIVQGVMDPVELTPGAWNVTVFPKVGPAWPTYTFLLTEDLQEPVNIVDLAPEIVINGQSFAKGDPGPTIASWEDNEDGTIKFLLTDGTYTDSGTMPHGPQGPVGPQGEPGPQGPQGPAGPPETHTHPITGVDGLQPIIDRLTYDSGWRSISNLLLNDWKAYAYPTLLRRVGVTCELRAYLDKTDATADLFLEPIAGFGTGTITASVGAVYGSVTNSTVAVTQNRAGFSISRSRMGQNQMMVSMVWTTTDPIPTTLPGYSG